MLEIPNDFQISKKVFSSELWNYHSFRASSLIWSKKIQKKFFDFFPTEKSKFQSGGITKLRSVYPRPAL